ncbi:MAG: hypothetical protein ACR5LG_14475 [Sodalis sp. (in: enterobacteria)]|uniref:hypothetical protein n=1 Tax=Sodalis sp. (in: enterobacteria) TaxID=1898979 RepID=UPI003F3E9314
MTLTGCLPTIRDDWIRRSRCMSAPGWRITLMTRQQLLRRDIVATRAKDHD